MIYHERKNFIESKIEIFQNAEFGEIRTAIINGEPYFVANG